MSDQTPDLAALAALAEAATPGPWVAHVNDFECVVVMADDDHWPRRYSPIASGMEQGESDGEADAAYIAAADPATVLWLIREVSDLRAEVAELERQLDADAKHAALGPGESCDVCTHRSFEEILADCESLSAGIEKAEATIERARELADSWAGSRSDLGPVTRACGALLRAALDGGESDG